MNNKNKTGFHAVLSFFLETLSIASSLVDIEGETSSRKTTDSSPECLAIQDQSYLSNQRVWNNNGQDLKVKRQKTIIMLTQGCARWQLLLIPLATLLLHTLYAVPQNPNIEAIVKDIFSTAPSQPPQRGFAAIVTPEPIDPSKPQPKFNSISGKKQCNCVPYHMCDPTTNAVTNNNNNNNANNNIANNNNANNNAADGGDFDGFGLIDIRFNADDPVCDHFLDVCCATGSTTQTSITPTPVVERPNRPQGCGIRNVGGIDFNITGANNNEAGFGEFPWTTALLHASNLSYFCAGSLIHPRVMLTAVHCVINRPINSFIVRAGEWDSQTTKERLPYVERSVQRVITHPQYNVRNVAYDFAIVILNDLIPLADHINVVCLPAQNAVPATRTTCLSTGWGKDVFGAAGRWSAIMKRVPLPIVEFNDCQERLRATRLGPRFALDPSFICAGGEINIDTCQGDGGAPLVCPIGQPGENRYHQSGIVAWGIGCNAEIPAAYANVALVRSWIDEQMLANGFDTTSYTAI